MFDRHFQSLPTSAPALHNGTLSWDDIAHGFFETFVGITPPWTSLLVMATVPTHYKYYGKRSAHPPGGPGCRPTFKISSRPRPPWTSSRQFCMTKRGTLPEAPPGSNTNTSRIGPPLWSQKLTIA